MKAGKTNIDVGTRIRTTRAWGGDDIVTGEITHPFGCYGAYDRGAIAGIYIDAAFQKKFGEIGQLFPGDFEVIKNKKGEE
jgi:hypothetical protein